MTLSSATLAGLAAMPDRLEAAFRLVPEGRRTWRSLVHYLASHDHQHLACLDWLLGQLHAEAGVR